jgi:hypothetical protein
MIFTAGHALSQNAAILSWSDTVAWRNAAYPAAGECPSSAGLRLSASQLAAGRSSAVENCGRGYRAPIFSQKVPVFLPPTAIILHAIVL